jgi:hypothetical protein
MTEMAKHDSAAIVDIVCKGIAPTGSVHVLTIAPGKDSIVLGQGRSSRWCVSPGVNKVDSKTGCAICSQLLSAGAITNFGFALLAHEVS